MAPADRGRADLRAAGGGCPLLPIWSHRRRPSEPPSFGRSTGALRSRTWATSAWSVALPAGARVRPGRPSAAAEQADAEPSTRCRAAAGRLDGHLLDHPRRLSAHRSPPTNSRPGSRTEPNSTGAATGTERVFQPTRLRPPGGAHTPSSVHAFAITRKEKRPWPRRRMDASAACRLMHMATSGLARSSGFASVRTEP
jgi:hypothetical protein